MHMESRACHTNVHGSAGVGQRAVTAGLGVVFIHTRIQAVFRAANAADPESLVTFIYLISLFLKRLINI